MAEKWGILARSRALAPAEKRSSNEPINYPKLAFKKDPKLATLYPGIDAQLKKLLTHTSTQLVILSGRSLSSLTPLLSLHPFPELWGCHGGERLKECLQTVSRQAEDPATHSQLLQAAQDAAQLAPDLYCELKPLSVALHWRGQEAATAEKQSLEVLKAWKRYLPQRLLDLLPFEEGIELRVRGIHKGQAINQLLKEYSDHTPIAYLGDDLTDEEAFEALGERGLKVLVRTEERPTYADLQLTPPEELRDFLHQWIISTSKE